MFKTNISTRLKTAEDVKRFISDLHKNGETFHFDDDVFEIAWTFPTTKDELHDLNGRMAELWQICRDSLFCPHGYLLSLECPPVYVQVNGVLFRLTHYGVGNDPVQALFFALNEYKCDIDRVNAGPDMDIPGFCAYAAEWYDITIEHVKPHELTVATINFKI